MSNVEQFMRLFRGYDKRHGRYIIGHQEESGKYTGKASTVDQPPCIEDFDAHLSGEQGIGIIPLTGDNRCYFAAIDIDVYPVDHLKIAWAVRDMPLFVTRSKSNGAHIWLFVPDGAAADVVVRFMKKVAGELGYGGCEIFPKQTRRASVHDVGNWINLPYFGDSRMGVVIVSDTKKKLIEYDLEDWLKFVYENIEGVTEAELNERAPRVTGTRSTKSSKKDYEDGPPCLERIKADGLAEGARNNVMYQVVQYLSRKYSSDEEIESRATAWNHTVYSSPLPANEIRAVIKSIKAKERGFKCNEEPMKGRCDRSTCLRRAFGIGSHSGDLDFEIGGFSRILTVPPMYAFNADGKRVELPNVRALSNQKEFRNYLMDAISKVMPLLQQGKYDELLRDWLKNCEDVVMAPDADPRMQWTDMLIEFLENHRNDDRARITQGHSWFDYDNGLVYFRLQDVKNYMRKMRVQFQDGPLLLYLQNEMGVIYNRKGTTVGGTSPRLYSVPISKLDLSEPSEPAKDGDVM